MLDAITAYLGHYNSNLGGAFFSSAETVSVVEKARASAQALLGAPSADNIVFGANMTSLTFQLSRAISRDWQAGDEIIVTALDHYSNVSSWQQAAEDKGVIVHQVRVNEADCTLDYDHFLSLLNANTRLVAVTYASNTTGSLVDVKRVIEAAHQVEAQVYVDAVHYAPHALVDVQALGCDFLACSAISSLARMWELRILHQNGCRHFARTRLNLRQSRDRGVLKRVLKVLRRWQDWLLRLSIWRSGR